MNDDTDTSVTCRSSHWLILGGTRSGKSRYAEQQVMALSQSDNNPAKPVFYLATATAADTEMQQRIALHQQQRPNSWQTIECPYDLAESLRQLQQQAPNAIVLVDCLTLWLTNELLGKDPDYSLAEPQICYDEWQQAKDALLKVLQTTTLTVIMVSNEVGQGITPLGRLSRTFVDEAGRLHQQIAAQIDHAVMVIAGLPMVLKTPTCSI